MRILQGIKVGSFTALCMVLVSMMSAQSSDAQLANKIQTHSVFVTKNIVDPAGDIGMAADAIARSQFADIYTGMALTDHGSHVNIYLTKPDPKAEKAIEGTNASNKFTFIVSPHNETQMLDIHQAVLNQATKLQAQGIDIVIFGPDVKTGKERIEVENLTPSEQDYLNSLFGAENIEVQNTTSKPMIFVYHPR